MDQINESKIFWDNCIYNGIDLIKYFEHSGSLIAEQLFNKYGKSKSYAVICGLGGNGADGLAIAKNLHKLGVSKLTVYIIGRVKHSKDPVFKHFANEIIKLGVELKQDCYAEDIEQSNVTIESLVGTGLEGTKLNKRFYDVIKRISHFSSKLIAIDIPVPHYKPDTTYSILYPKTANAETIQVKFPAEVLTFCGPGEYKALWKPNTKSHTLKNGQMLYIDQNSDLESVIQSAADSYHTKAKAFFFDGLTTRATRLDLLNSDQLEEGLEEAGCILIGDVGDNIVTMSTIGSVVHNYEDKKFIFFGKSTALIDEHVFSHLADSLIITDRIGLKKMIGRDLASTNLDGIVRRFCIENRVNLILTGSKTILCNASGDFRIGYAKGIYEKNYVAKLAAQIAAFATKNDIWLSMRAGVFVI